jgi:hypothetical protein
MMVGLPWEHRVGCDQLWSGSSAKANESGKQKAQESDATRRWSRFSENKKKGVVQSKIDRRLHKDAHVGENKRKKARKKKKTLKQRNQQNTIWRVLLWFRRALYRHFFLFIIAAVKERGREENDVTRHPVSSRNQKEQAKEKEESQQKKKKKLEQKQKTRSKAIKQKKNLPLIIMISQIADRGGEKGK